MISEPLRKIAADSNVILSAVIGKAALRIFAYPSIQCITTRFNLLEVEEYLPRLAAKYRLERTALLWQLKMLPLFSFPEEYYASRRSDAERILNNRDLDDTHLAALALKEDVPIWSNDRDFEQRSIPVYTTAQLLKMLKIS